MGKLFDRKYQLNYFDFDKNYKLKPTTMMNFLQDISTIHFESMTQSISEDVLIGLWVIVEWQITFEHMPKNTGDIIVGTEPTYFRKFIAYRQYEIADLLGNPIGSGISKWAYIDPVSRKQVNIPKILNEVFGVSEHAEKPNKLIFQSFDNLSSDKIQRLAVYTDIDVNKHVNNVTYIRWALDALGSDFLDQYQLSNLKVSFKKEVFEGQMVTIESVKKETATGAISQHNILNEDEQSCVQVEFTWSKAD